jgi:N-succinyldiaminopimelate aminotransferase
MASTIPAQQHGASRTSAGPDGERSPFARLTELLAPYQPGLPLITLSLGEPQHPVPDFVGPILAKHINDFGRYPIAKGIEPFRKAAATWITKRFDLPRAVDPETEVLVLNGSREGLFFAGIAAARYVGPREGKPAILLPNPFYPAYGAGARAAGCEAIFLPTTVENGFLPNLAAIDEAILRRTAAIYIASPANPQGAVATPEYFKQLHALSLKHGFIVLSDECYSEIYTREAPGSMLAQAGSDFQNVVAFHELRNVAAPQVPVPLQQVAVAAYSDESHVEENRRLYGLKFDLADQILGSRHGYKRPAGGFCLWLDVTNSGGDEEATVRLYRDGGVRVVPGSYLARTQPDGSNPGAGYIRIAMVQDSDTTAEALHRLVKILG